MKSNRYRLIHTIIAMLIGLIGCSSTSKYLHLDKASKNIEKGEFCCEPFANKIQALGIVKLKANMQ